MTTLALASAPPPHARLMAAQPVDCPPRWHSVEAILSSGPPPVGSADAWRSIDPRQTPIVSIAVPPGDSDRTLIARTPSSRQEGIDRVATCAAWSLKRQCRLLLLEAGRVELPDVEQFDEEILGTIEGPPLSEQRRGEIESLRSKAITYHLDALCRALHTLGKAHPEIIWCLGPASTPMGLLGADEVSLVLEDLGRSSIRLGYWHRTGICHRRERLGLEPAEAWLDLFGSQTRAVRLEDVRASLVGLLPGTGEVDFSQIVRALPRETVRSVQWPEEFSPSDLADSHRFLQDKGLL